jgi:hypothetical protein
MNLIDKRTGIFIILIVGMLAFFIARKSGSRVDSQRTQVETSVAEPPPKQALIAAPAKPDEAEALKIARRNYNIVVLNGITKVPALVKNGKLSLSIQPKPEAQWCKGGDFDVIKMLAPNTQDKFITLSLESMTSENIKRVQTYSLSELNAGKSTSFDIPLDDEAYGLYLCIDQNRKGSCAKKQAVPAEIWSSSAKKMKGLAANKIFYFQLIQIKDKTAHIIPSQAWGKHNLRALKSRLGDWMGDDLSALERMDELVSKIRPMPARLAESHIEIPLLYNDMRCVGR